MSTREERWNEIDASVARVRPAVSLPNRSVFRTLTSEDWAREIKRARETRNAISDQIRARILDGVGNAQPAAEEHSRKEQAA